jgi:hypothetical protein
MKYKNRVSFFIFLILLCVSIKGFSANLFENGKLKVLKNGNTVYIRSGFSEKEDLIVTVGLGRNNKQINFNGTFLLSSDVPVSAEMTKGAKGIHGTGDDTPAIHINGTYIAGNHGTSIGLQVVCKEHGLTSSNLGSEWEDEAGKKFYLIKIVDENQLLFLGRNRAKGDIWQFESTARTNTVLKNNLTGKVINYTKQTLGVQIWPSLHIKKQEYMVDGKKVLKEGEVVECEWLDIIEEYEVVNTGSLLADIIKNSGQERDFVADHLDTVLQYNLTYRFFPNGANVIYHKIKTNQEFRLGQFLFLCSAKLYKGKYGLQEYYVPKTLPFTQNDISYDFRGIQNYNERPPSPITFNEKLNNLSDTQNPPDRFIQFLSEKEGDNIKREVGFALGYSVLYGMGQPSMRIQNAGNFLMLYTSQKTYPFVADRKFGSIIPKGSEFYCVGYRQYFNPQRAGNATCLYWNQQEKDTVVYIDYHKSVEKDTVKLPANMVGKKIEIIEKSDSLALDTKKVISAEGINVSVKDNYGYVVFKVK